MIKPTIGRVVLYRNDSSVTHYGDNPNAAIVVHVWNDTMVNLVVFDSNGGIHPKTNVTLRQSEDEAPQVSFCEWMPYQQGQAAKTEALEKKLEEAKS